MPSSLGVAAVFVTWHPDPDFGGRLEKVGRQVGAVVIVDNGSEPEELKRLRALRRSNLRLIENGANRGIAAALNQGVRLAVELGYPWVLTLDQDTEVDANLVAGLLAIYERCLFADQVGIVAANARSPISGIPMVRHHGNSEFIEVRTTITSGSLLSATAYSVAGPFREEFFIEGVDLEYCLRLRSHGYRIILSASPLITHAAGQMQERRFLWRKVVVPNHPPWRHYYQARNLTVVARSYLASEPGWVARSILNVAKGTVKTALFEQERMKKLWFIFRGVIDGMKARGMEMVE